MRSLFTHSHPHTLTPSLQAYYWLRQNTAEDSKVMSWWDYGYQITAMANRTILVDNNTWNNTHISRVGQVGAVAMEITHRQLLP